MPESSFVDILLEQHGSRDIFVERAPKNTEEAEAVKSYFAGPNGCREAFAAAGFNPDDVIAFFIANPSAFLNAVTSC